MASNKEKILTSSLKLFNAHGIVNVRLQHISDDCIVSVGNLAYHFKNKEAILSALYKDLTQKQKELLVEYRIVPLFDNIDHIISVNYDIQQEYIFFYKDTLEIIRSFPEVASDHQVLINSLISQWNVILDFNVARGALISEPISGTYALLAEQIWRTMDFWLYQDNVRLKEVSDKAAYQRAIWNLIIPFFTPMGHLEYKQMQQLKDQEDLL